MNMPWFITYLSHPSQLSVCISPWAAGVVVPWTDIEYDHAKVVHGSENKLISNPPFWVSFELSRLVFGEAQVLFLQVFVELLLRVAFFLPESQTLRVSSFGQDFELASKSEMSQGIARHAELAQAGCQVYQTLK